MAEDALFAFIPGYPVRSRRPFTPSTRLVAIRRGLSSNFEWIRTASSDVDRIASKKHPPPRFQETTSHNPQNPAQVRYVVKNIPMEMVVAGTDSASSSLNFST